MGCILKIRRFKSEYYKINIDAKTLPTVKYEIVSLYRERTVNLDKLRSEVRKTV